MYTYSTLWTIQYVKINSFNNSINYVSTAMRDKVDSASPLSVATAWSYM